MDWVGCLSDLTAQGGRVGLAGLRRRAQVVVVSSRVHPGESPASHILIGLVDFISSDDKRARLLREHLVFKAPPLPHLHRDWARPCHFCTGTGLAPATSAPGLHLTFPSLRAKPQRCFASRERRTAMRSAMRRDASPFAVPKRHVSFLMFARLTARRCSTTDQPALQIIPMLNPDGVYHGHYRADSLGQNLNRSVRIAAGRLCAVRQGSL